MLQEAISMMLLPLHSRSSLLVQETLFDSSVDYEKLCEDYFSHAYGKAWREVVEYLDSLCRELKYSYYFGLDSAAPEKGKYYCPEMLEPATRAEKIIKNFIPTIEANLEQDERASSVAWQLLKLHSIAASKFAEMTKYKCVGNEEAADRVILELADAMSEHEIYYERYYDHYLFIRTMKRFMKNKDIIDNLNV